MTVNHLETSIRAILAEELPNCDLVLIDGATNKIRDFVNKRDAKLVSDKRALLEALDALLDLVNEMKPFFADFDENRDIGHKLCRITNEIATIELT